MTTPGTKTQQVALKILEQKIEDLPNDEFDLLSGEGFFVVQLSKDLGLPRSLLLDILPSSDWTHYRAAAIVEAAQSKVVAKQAEDRAKNARNKRRR